MRLTKYTHACVRLEHDGRVLVIDPGVWSEPRALRLDSVDGWLAERAGGRYRHLAPGETAPTEGG